MKTLLISPKFPPQRCGVGDYTAALAQFLHARGDDVCVVTAAPRGPHHEAGVRVRAAEMRGWRDLLGLAKIIREEAPAWVQLEYSGYGWHRFGCPLWLNALFAVLRMSRLRVRLALHEFPLNFGQHPKQIPIAIAQRLHTWLLCACSHEVCCNTIDRVSRLRRWLPWRRSSLHYRPNSNSNPVFPFPAEWRHVLREERGVQPGDLVLGVYGLFGAGKNTESAIRAVAQLRGELRLHLWLLGDYSGADPNYIAQLRRAAEPLGRRAWWSGALRPEDVSRHLQALDIFLLPQADGHLTRSSSFMAAAAHGLPVIAVRNDVNQREFTHGVNVWLTNQSTEAALSQAIRELVLDSARRVKLANNLRSLYQSAFDWPAMAARLAAPPASLDGSASWNTSSEPSRKAS